MDLKNEVMDIVFLLDRSGSMSGMEEDTIKGFNSYIKKMKKSNARVTAVLFDDEYEMIIKRKDIKKVRKLTKETYYTRGCTALFDAIGRTIKYMDEKDTSKVLFIITTDGYENSSKEYKRNQIRNLIKNHDKWEFIYLGADIDSYREADSLGISDNRTSNYSKTKKGLKNLFERLNIFSVMYEVDCITDDWKDGLEDNE